MLQNVNNTRLTIYVLQAKQQIGIDKGHYWQKLKKGQVIGFASRILSTISKMSKIVHTYYVKGTYFNI